MITMTNPSLRLLIHNPVKEIAVVDVTPSPLLSKDQLQQIAHLIIRTSQSDVVRVQVEHLAHAVTRIVNDKVLTSDNGTTLTLTIATSVGGRRSVSFTMNQTNESAVRAAIVKLDALSRQQAGSSENPLYIPDEPQTYMPVQLWHNNTVQAMATVGDTVVPRILHDIRAENLRGSAFIGLMARRIFVLQKDGFTVFGEETDAECSVSARTPDGKASGWYGQANRDWNAIQPVEITQKAISMAKGSIGASAVEPGRRTAILSPFALAQVMRHLSRGFDAYETNVRHTTVFSTIGDPERDNKIGLRVFDPSIVISSNPADPDGGYFPFGDMRHEGICMPTQAITYVKGGVLQDLAYRLFYNLGEGKPFNQNPWSMRLDTMPATPLMTLDEMIANCKDGIYVNRFSNVDELDSLTGMQTGVTRDGCFLVKNGKINRPVKNFRFTDSPMYFLNRLAAIGKAERTALGFTPPVPSEPSYASDWPRRPLIIPPVMVDDFNFSALSDAV